MKKIGRPTSGGHVLERILNEAEERGKEGKAVLAVFDLDSTLFDLTLRVARIVDDFANDARNRERFPEECQTLKKLQLQRSDWGLGEPLGRIGLTELKHKEFYQELHKHWALQFFSSSYLHCDTPLPGAPAFVSRLLELGADVMYLTGRDVPRMYEGTELSLRTCGFPVGVEKTSLILKPKADLDDARFKADVLRDALPKYERIWLFENEPVNLNLVARELPSVGLVYIDTVHSGREEVGETLDRILHFEIDSEEFSQVERGK